MTKGVYVINWAGEKEPFSWKKVFNSARRVGADERLAREIARTVEKEVYPGIRTREIFARVLQILNQKNPPLATIFNLKEALRRLGPTGFPFEKYIGRILEEEGFRVKLNQIVNGFCTHYEIDFLAEKEGVLYIGECKYHQIPGLKVDLTVALANYARFLDIKKGGKLGNQPLKSVLVTNTKFSAQAIEYSECVGVSLLGWKYPSQRSLEKIIDEKRLYPITIFPEINNYLIRIFFKKGIILISDLLQAEEKELKKEGLSPGKIKNLLKKAASVMDYSSS